MEFDLHGKLKEMLSENQVDPEFALNALFEGLIENHLEKCEERTTSAFRVPSTLESMHSAMYSQYKRNREIYDTQARDDEPNDDAWMAGILYGQVAHAQGVLSDLVHACLEAAEPEDVCPSPLKFPHGGK